MTITFDQFLDVVTRISEPEPGFGIQADVHASAAIIEQWQNDDLSNSQVVEIMNLDNTDPELPDVKVHLDTLNRADTLALQSAMILAKDGVSATGITYDKAYLRPLFGLT